MWRPAATLASISHSALTFEPVTDEPDQSDNSDYIHCQPGYLCQIGGSPHGILPRRSTNAAPNRHANPNVGRPSRPSPNVGRPNHHANPNVGRASPSAAHPMSATPTPVDDRRKHRRTRVDKPIGRARSCRHEAHSIRRNGSRSCSSQRTQEPP